MTNLKLVSYVEENQRRLGELESGLLEGLNSVAVTLECAVEAIELRDLDLAGMVVGDDHYTDARYVQTNAGVLSLLGEGSLGEQDVRTAMGLLRLSRHVERIGDLCVNVAKLVRLHARAAGSDPDMLEAIGDMGGLAHKQLWHARAAFAQRDVTLVEDLVTRDEKLNELNRACFRLALQLGDDPERRAWAMHIMLAARWLERIGDNAVDIGELAAFVATGQVRKLRPAPRAGTSRR